MPFLEIQPILFSHYSHRWLEGKKKIRSALHLHQEFLFWRSSLWMVKGALKILRCDQKGAIKEKNLQKLFLNTEFTASSLFPYQIITSFLRRNPKRINFSLTINGNNHSISLRFLFLDIKEKCKFILKRKMEHLSSSDCTSRKRNLKLSWFFRVLLTSPRM